MFSNIPKKELSLNNNSLLMGDELKNLKNTVLKRVNDLKPEEIINFAYRFISDTEANKKVLSKLDDAMFYFFILVKCAMINQSGENLFHLSENIEQLGSEKFLGLCIKMQPHKCELINENGEVIADSDELVNYKGFMEMDKKDVSITKQVYSWNVNSAFNKIPYVGSKSQLAAPLNFFHPEKNNYAENNIDDIDIYFNNNYSPNGTKLL